MYTYGAEEKKPTDALPVRAVSAGEARCPTPATIIT